MEIFLWLLLALIVGVAARNRYGRSGFAWFLISTFLSPLIGFFLLFACGPKRDAALA